MFTLISYPLRYMAENFMQIWGTLIIDINDWTSSGKRELSDSKDLAVTIVAILIISVYSLALFSLAFVAI